MMFQDGYAERIFIYMHNVLLSRSSLPPRPRSIRSRWAVRNQVPSPGASAQVPPLGSRHHYGQSVAF